jgi:hypothetical protein
MARVGAFAIALALLGCGSTGRSVTLDGGLVRVSGLEPGDRPGTLRVFVAGAAVPVLGETRDRDGDLVFEPRFPFRPGLEYRVVFQPAAGPALERTISLPAPEASPVARVTRLFPSASLLPENQLKFYLHFSAPMARGEAYRRIHLVESGGREVEMPFLELGEELWDPSGTRFTLFFDPGRIKRGLKPRLEAGPSLEEGKSYTLVIDREWSDALGRPMREGFRKPFRVGPPDDRQPDPAQWKLLPPRSGTRDPFTVRFEKPMDESMLHRVLSIRGGSGEVLAGHIDVDEEETRWRFIPDRPWARGPHALRVDTLLEDLAGNSIARPFEVDVVRPVERRLETQVVTLPVEIRD